MDQFYTLILEESTRIVDSSDLETPSSLVVIYTLL